MKVGRNLTCLSMGTTTVGLLLACTSALTGPEDEITEVPLPLSAPTFGFGIGAPSGPHYSLNIVAVPKKQSPDMTQANGQLIYVKLNGKNRILLCESGTGTTCNDVDGFNVLDADGTDGSASFALPSNDPQANGTLTYFVYVRAVDTPEGGRAANAPCGMGPGVDGILGSDDDEELCAVVALTLEPTLEPRKGRSRSFDVGNVLLHVWVDLDGDGGLELMPLFDDRLADYFWNDNDDGLKSAQLRFYEPATNETPVGDVHAWHEALLSEATGYFAAAGGTGGHGGEVVYVTNLEDSGPGSMRAALESPETLIILFENGVDGVLAVTSDDIDVRSNKTIWGRHRDGSAADIFVHPEGKNTPFKIANGNGNVIIANLKGDAPGPNDDAPDFIAIQGTGGLVWVHHVSVVGDGSNNMDGFVDVHAENVTLSWNRIEGWSGVHLVYPYPDGDGAVTLTLNHNLFRNSAGRQPKLDNANVVAHAYNNWLDNWGYDGMRVTAGQLRADHNLFTPGAITTDKQAIQGVWAGSGNVFLEGAFADGQSTVFSPPYSYTPDPIGTAAEQQALRDRLEAGAGWQNDLR